MPSEELPGGRDWFRDPGPPVRRFVRTPVALLHLAGGASLIALGAGVFGLALETFLAQASRDAEAFWSRAFWFAFGLASIAVGGIVIQRGVRLIRSSVVVYEGGLVCFQGKRREALGWAEVAVLTRGNPPGHEFFATVPSARIRLRDRAGREWEFNQTLSGFKEFRSLVEERTLPALLGEAVEALERGRPLRFGEVEVDRDGLSFRRQGFLAWGQITESGVHAGRVYAMSRLLTEPYFNEPVFGVPNAHVLLALIQRYREGPPGRQPGRAGRGRPEKKGDGQVRPADESIQ